MKAASDYECHITMELVPKSKRQDIKDLCASYGFWVSHIDNDLELGKGVKSYATAHGPNMKELKHTMMCLSAHLRGSGGMKVLRNKIEKIIYDVRFE